MTVPTLALLALLPAQAPTPLPANWHGTYAGTLVIRSAAGRTTEVPMTLEIAPDGDTLAWRIGYGEGDKKQLRDYRLVPKADGFEIDERNGIRLDARLVGDALVCCFKVDENLIHTRYERTAEGVRFELTSHATAKPLVTKPNAGGPNVESFRPTFVQTATLKRAAK